MKVKFANKWYDVLDTRTYFGMVFYAIEDEPGHVDWITNPQQIKKVITVKKTTFMQEKLLTEKDYMPYCGGMCNIMPRTYFDGEQFVCPCCGWRSNYPKEFIEEYKKKWNK